jgi:ABC-type nickel/cobalt efflux system permease component RcnA
MPESHLISLLTLGLLLGAKHALDADHIAAILAISAQNRSVWRSSLIGLCWGMGHTLVLLLMGVAVIFFKLAIPQAWTRLFEGGVGAVLIALGVSVAVGLWREGWHLHAHTHEAGPTHRHFHAHRDGTGHAHGHRFGLEVKSLAVGMIHGLAGSAALLLLVLATVPTVWSGILYICVFGVGSIAGMVVLATVLSVPFAASADNMTRGHQALRVGAALLSIVLGTRMVLELLSA